MEETTWDIRLLDPSSQLSEIAAVNELLGAAYLSSYPSGYSSGDNLVSEFAAAKESVESTARRIREGECFLAFQGDQLVGCVILRTKSKPGMPAWYQNPGVASFGRLAVRPDFRNQGIATALIRYIETKARQSGYSELALDTSEGSRELIGFYERLGYRKVSHHHWSRTPFRSVVLSKSL
jgi:ribosomal protein S18 acetylase RimI-like enzyme